ncbi:general substrate transporter [Auriculariales sp. MPI-PUGE-AT-0066]|nr:general substrate transporter [Auriculariales sp. MPI-PUGE-AT-0066]
MTAEKAGRPGVETQSFGSQTGASSSGSSTRAVIKDGIPYYAGLTGDQLLSAITVTSTFGFLLFGYDQGVMSGLISAPQFYRVFPDLDPVLTSPSHSSLMQAFYTAIYEIGCLAGAIFALFMGNKLGRRRNIMIGSTILILGAIIQVTAMPRQLAGHQFVIGRIVTGFGNGLNTATIPSWQAECSKSHNRGLHICIEASMIATGTVIAYWIDFGLSYIDSSVSWRVPIALQTIFAVLVLLGVSRLPESPRYLLSTGQTDEGVHVVGALLALPIDHPDTQLQKRVIVEALESLGELKIRHVLTGGPSQHLRRTLIGASSQFFQQIGGCNAVIYFSPVIFETYIGLPRRLSLILGGVNATVYALSAFLSYPMIERLGRRKMYFWARLDRLAACMSHNLADAGHTNQFLRFLAMACLIPYDVQGKTNSTATYGAVVGLYLYLIAFGCTWLELPWLYPAEINPNAIRTNANAISTCTNWLWNFAGTLSAFIHTAKRVLTLHDSSRDVDASHAQLVGWVRHLLVLLGVNMCFFPFIYYFYVETKGRSLEEIDIIFAKGYTANESYVKVGHELPSLTPAEIEREAARWGLADEAKHSGQAQELQKKSQLDV